MKRFTFASENRLRVDISTLVPTLAPTLVNIYLACNGFKVFELDIIDLARQQLGKSYCRGTEEKKDVFDCSSFTQWLYGEIGIAIPRISINQREFGEPVDSSLLKKGDLVFTDGHINYFWDGKEKDGVGHVGIFTGESVIHAASVKRGVTEDTLEDFFDGVMRGAVRMHPNLEGSVTVIMPEKDRVSCDFDLRWRLLQKLG